MKPKHFCPTSHKMAWWQCPENESHCFQATIAQIVTKNRVCPECKELRAKEHSFAKIYPELATTWHPTKNGNLTADDVAQTSHKKFGGIVRMHQITSGIKLQLTAYRLPAAPFVEAAKYQPAIR